MSKADKADKTNAMRLLDRARIAYEALSYPSDGTALDAPHVAALLQEDPARVFKTLVLMGSDGQLYACLLPGDAALDLKAAAAHFGVKSLRMAEAGKLKELTGYVRGGCSPLGMKKALPTAADRSALAHPYILVSAGRIGQQIKIDPQALARAANLRWADLTQDSSDAEAVQHLHNL